MFEIPSFAFSVTLSIALDAIFAINPTLVRRAACYVMFSSIRTPLLLVISTWSTTPSPAYLFLASPCITVSHAPDSSWNSIMFLIYKHKCLSDSTEPPSLNDCVHNFLKMQLFVLFYSFLSYCIFTLFFTLLTVLIIYHFPLNLFEFY